MKNLIKITLLAAIFVISGCGDDQADQAVQQKQDAKEEQAVPVAVTPVISTETETTITPPADISYTKPAWAVLEQNVYYYPETETIITPPADISYTKPAWAVLEQNVYYYPETETSSMTDKAVDMAKDAAQNYIQDNKDELIDMAKEKASEMVQEQATDMAKEQAIEATKESAIESAKDMLKDKF